MEEKTVKIKGDSGSINKVAKLWPKKEQGLQKDMRLDGDFSACHLYLFPPSHKWRQESLFFSIAAWFIAGLAQRSCKTTEQILPDAMAMPGLQLCPKVLGLKVNAGMEASAWRTSHLEEPLGFYAGSMKYC